MISHYNNFFECTKKQFCPLIKNDNKSTYDFAFF